jgi:hypothetical protein
MKATTTTILDMMSCFLTNTPLDPSRHTIRSVHRPTPLETWSWQGLVVNPLRTRGCEPLRSASRRLGFMINALFGNPGHQLVVGPSSGSRCLQASLGSSSAPARFWGGTSWACIHTRSPSPRGSSASRWMQMSLSRLTGHDLVR